MDRKPASRQGQVPPGPDHQGASGLSTLPGPLRAKLQALLDSSGVDAGRRRLLDDTLESLRRLGADNEALVAAVLDAVPNLEDAQLRDVAELCPGVPSLLEGQRAAAQVWNLHAGQAAGSNAEGLRRLLLAIVRDLRVVPILLAGQLAKMRAASAAPERERRALALARLTHDVHAPLANRLGIWQLKWELEDLAFRYLEPDTYKRIARLLDDKRTGRERYIEGVKNTLGAALAEQGLDADVAGRPKHIYSIWKKMQKKGVPIGELYDLRAVRVLVEDVPACYAALGVVHALWVPVPSEFDDYIARPKNNDYRSLHTAVIGPGGKTLEVQIRTREMHRQAELGVAAHWRYKEHSYRGGGGSQRSAAANAANDRKIEWMRRLLEGSADTHGEGGGLAGGLGTELVEDRVFALTPMGKVIDLPAGATPLDFAYHVHTEVGHRCRGAKVDGRIVPLDHRLRSGERVEILTARTGEPRRDWLVESNGFLASARSREKVRAWFHRLERDRNIAAGRELLERELRRLGVANADLASVVGKFNAASVEDLQVLVALGDVGPHQVGRALLEAERTSEPPDPALASVLSTRARRRSRRAGPDVTVVGVGNLLVQLARCCGPLPGEAIAGYLTSNRGVSVHRADCGSFLRLAGRQPQRVLPVEWGTEAAGGHESEVRVEAIDRKGLLKELATRIAQEDAHILDIHSEALRGGRVRFRLRLRVHDFGQLSRLLGALERLPAVESARRA